MITLVLPLCSNIFFLGVQHYKKVCNDASKVLLESSYIKIQLMLNLIYVNNNFIQFLASHLNIEDIKNENIKEKLNLKLKNNFEDVSIISINKERKQTVILSTDPEQLKNHSHYCSTLLLMPIQKISFSIEQGSHLSITTCENIIQPDGSILSIYILYRPTTILPLILQSQENKIIVNTALLTPEHKIVESNKKNIVINQENFIEKQLGSPALKIFLDNIKILQKNLKNPQNIQPVAFVKNNRIMWGYKTIVPNTDITLVSYSSKTDILQPVKNKLLPYGFYILFIIFGGFILLLISKKFSTSIQKLDGVMTQIQEGHLNARYYPTPWGFEINDLGLIFNHMIDEILKQQSIAESEIIHKELITKELSLGEQAQEILLSVATPYYPNISLSKIYIPAAIVSGDFYDIFTKINHKGETELFLIVADASGKGVNGCCYSLILKNLLATYLKECDSIEQAVVSTNIMFQKDTEESGMFVTAAIIKYNQKTSCAFYYSCGHPSIGLIKKNREAIFVYHPGKAFGILPMNTDIKPMKIPFSQGDVLVLYSDGVTEAQNDDLELFGEQRLQRSLSQIHNLSASDINHFLMHEIHNFTKNQEQYDDITVLVLKVEEHE